MNKDYKNQVLEKIQKKEISMRPRLYFIGYVVAIATLAVVVFLVLIFIVSFILFSIYESGEHLLLTFGNHGIVTFLKILPWNIIISSFVILLVLEWILRRFKFGYRLSLVRIFLYTFIVTTFLGLVFALTPLHTTLLRQAQLGNLPFIGKIYDAVRDSHQDKGILRGTVNSIGVNSFVISHNDADSDEDDGTWTIVPPVSFDMTSIHVGDEVYVAGDIKEGKVEAYGVGVMRGE